MTRNLPVEEACPDTPGGDDIRLRALERLYLRRDAVDALIRSLERYQVTRRSKAECLSITAKRKCS
jgi:hypothetical protein